MLEAEGGSAVLRLIQTGVHIDLLISDYGLPGSMNGRQVIDMVHEHHPELPAIVITGYASTAQLSDLEVIRKPFNPAMLTDRVAAKLEEPDTSSRS
ncbi:MAG: response regulator [Rhodopila sp.]